MIENIEKSDELIEESFYPKSIRIEMSVDEPINKAKTKSFLFSLFDELKINDEKDLVSISYAISKNEELVQKLMLEFKSIESANKFFDHIESNKQMYKLSDLIKATTTTGDETPQQSQLSKEESGLEESICILSDMAYSYIDDASLIIETSYYEPTSFQAKSESQQQQQQQQQHQLVSNANEQNKQDKEDENYCLEFNSNKKINETILDAFVIYLENKATGCDIQTFQIEPESNGYQLIVKFESKSSADYFLKEKQIDFKNYKFQIAKQFTLKSTEQMNPSMKFSDSILLRNVPTNWEANIIKMLAENISLCKVKSLKSSKIFSDYLIEFDSEVDIVKTRERLVKRHSSIELSLPEKTNCILLLTQSMSLVESLASSCLIPIKSIHKRPWFYLIEFENDSNKLEFETNLGLFHEQSGFYYEDLFSFDSFKSKRSFQFKSESSTENKSNTNRIGGIAIMAFFSLILFSLLSRFLENASIIKEPKPTVNVMNENIIVDLNKRPGFKFLIYWPEKQTEMKNELKDLNAVVTFDFKSLNQIIIEPTIEELESKLFLKGNWHFTVNQYLNEQLQTYETIIVQIKNPISTIERLTYNRLRVHINKQDDLMWNSKFELTGFKEDVLNLMSKIEAENDKNLA